VNIIDTNLSHVSDPAAQALRGNAKALWVQPAVVRLEAGEAEGGDSINGDGGNGNLS
jgi:predicted CoA-binding protein